MLRREKKMDEILFCYCVTVGQYNVIYQKYVIYKYKIEHILKCRKLNHVYHIDVDKN